MNFIASIKSPLAQAGIWNSLTSLQKRIMGIALLALTALAMGYCILSCFRNKKSEQVNDKKDEGNDPKVTWANRQGSGQNRESCDRKAHS